VPGTSFHATPGSGTNYVRFAFCKKKETLERAVERIVGIRSLV
jgi:aspartate/methionine/tyrosine aminotransferase